MIQWFSIGWPAALPRIRVSTGAVLILLGCLSFGSAQAADTTPRQHAQGAYDAATGAYTVVKGDDLAAIAERFRRRRARTEVAKQACFGPDRGRSEAGDCRQRTGRHSADHWRPGFAERHHNHPRQSIATAAPPKFGGVIKEDAKDSKPWWPPTVVPPKGAPNVLLIMTDDSGFGVPSTFGGVIPTPTLDRIAKNGLRYTQFHSTAT